MFSLDHRHAGVQGLAQRSLGVLGVLGGKDVAQSAADRRSGSAERVGGEVGSHDGEVRAVYGYAHAILSEQCAQQGRALFPVGHVAGRRCQEQ
ncbi:hypothetical protein SBI_08690 [Streptomyces bingchenggensis BCW-1]|uniref:Uncharacterized protein n=1 Tax=Streptomyces bingchenggensis (strain BCW-1) TaxID=749414 RepID=D7BW98_STRBB|nr:hypothetical protein SBI_08690 [Streptomyces bingchenggensis BCW-1]